MLSEFLVTSIARCSAFLCGIFDGKLYTQRPWLPSLVDLLRHFWVAILFRTGREHHPPSQL